MLTVTPHPSPDPAPPSDGTGHTAIGSAARTFGGRALELLLRRVERSRRRQAYARLQSLDDRLLRDIGIDRSEIASIVICGSSDRTRRRRG